MHTVHFKLQTVLDLYRVSILWGTVQDKQGRFFVRIPRYLYSEYTVLLVFRIGLSEGLYTRRSFILAREVLEYYTSRYFVFAAGPGR